MAIGAKNDRTLAKFSLDLPKISTSERLREIQCFCFGIKMMKFQTARFFFWATRTTVNCQFFFDSVRGDASDNAIFFDALAGA